MSLEKSQDEFARKLYKLRTNCNRGIISVEEFQTKKAELVKKYGFGKGLEYFKK